ncbi:MAG: SH3 domain-containing protein [Tenericutes bacterium]|nr:SH3 domain-containing protein [Mycoplasmatota bacterium]
MGKKIELFESTANKHEVLGYNGIVLDEYCSYCQISESLSENDFSVELDLRFPESLPSQKVEEVEKEYAYIKYGYRTPYFLYDINNQDNAFLLEVGTKVEVLEKGEYWIKVKYNDSIGYIESVCLTNYTVETIREKIGEKTFGYTNKDYEISSIPANTRVEILDESNPYNYTIKHNEREYTFGKQINKNVSIGYNNKIKVLVDSKGYSSKDTSTTPLYTIPANTIVEYLDEYKGWVRVKYNNKISFVERVRIDRIKIGTFGIITANGGLNLRESYPSGTVLVTIPKNTKIKVLAQENGWIKTTYNNKTGWCSATYVGSITDEFREESVTQLGEKISEEIFEEIIIDTLQATREIEDIFETTNHEFAFTQTYIDKANIFERPSYDSLTDTVLDEGVVVEVLERKTTFIKVKYGNIIGWLEESKVENNFSEIVTVVKEKEDIIGKIKSILLNGSILKVKDEYDEYEIFRITNININTNNSTTTVYGRQITLEDSLRLWINSSKPTNMTGASALEKLYTDSEGRIKELTTYSNINTTDTVFIVRKNLNEAIFDDDVSFLERWGGEVERRGYNLSILKERGSDKGVVFRRGKNYTGIEEDVNQDKLVTRIIPIAFDGITLPEIYVDSPKINNYYNIFPQEIKFEEVKYKDSPNNSNKEGFDTLEEVYAELRKQASEYFTNNKCDELRGVYNIKVVDVSSTEEYKELSIFEKTWIGDTVTIIDEKLNLNIKARVTKRKFDVIKGMRIETEVTNITSRRQHSLSLESLQNQINNIQIPEAPDIDLIIQQAKKEAEEFIRNGITDSYVVLKENEILIMDTNNVDTAVKVLRMNKHGIAGSTTGYNGSFNLAMTIDGQIVADRITTGILNASLIKAGTLMSANGKSWLNMENGTFNFSNKITYDGSSFNISMGENEEINNLIDTKVDGLATNIANTYITNDSATQAFNDLDKNLQTNYPNNNNIISRINVSPEAIKISANRIEIDGNMLLSGVMKYYPYKTGNYIRITADVLNVRVSPNLNATIIGVLYRNDVVKRLETLNGWYKIEFGANVGYVASGHVESVVSSRNNYAKFFAQPFGNGTSMYVMLGGNQQDGAFEIVSENMARYFWVNYKGAHSSNYHFFHTDKPNTEYYTDTVVDNGYYRPTVNNRGSLGHRDYYWNQSWISNMYCNTVTVWANSDLRRDVIVGRNLKAEGNIICNGNIECIQGNGAINGNYLGSMGDIACRGTLHGGGLVVSGSKNCVQETENFGKRLINAYETADYYFGDIGESQTINGEMIIWIDDIFKEIISTEVDYQVFITKYGRGDIWVEERAQDYFVVKSENDISFGWEIKGKRKGYEKYRLEEYKEDK